MKRLAVVLAVLCAACRPSVNADRVLCEAILERTIELELDAMGFHHDPALSALKTKQLREKLAPSLNACIGRPAPRHALECVRKADSLAELRHDCLARDLDERTEHPR